MEVSNERHQTISSQLENAMMNQNSQQEQQIEKKLRPNPEQSLKCPRCDSSNTKFCYYNNYSLSQPRYFCKGCRRYWTQGGSLRNVPVGGGCRKNKRSSNSSKKLQPDHQEIVATNPNNPLLAATALPLPPLSYDPNELSLAFATLQNQPMMDCHDNGFLMGNPNPNPAAGFLDILRSGLVDNSYGFGAVGEVEGSGTGVSGVSGGVMMFPYDGGLMSSTEAVTTTTSATAPTVTETTRRRTSSQESMDGGDEDKKLMMGLHQHQWVVGGDHSNANANLGMDPVRDYWNNGVGSSWPGLINSSLI